MRSRGSGWIYVKFDNFLIKNQFKNSSRGSGWIYIKFDHFSIKNQSKNELQRLGPE